MLRFLYKLLLFLPILILVILVNYYVDPANLYRSDTYTGTGESYEKSIARYLTSGYNVTNVEMLDERLLQKFLILSRKAETVELAVLGSSRSQLLGSNLFPQKRIINNSVTGATIEDLLALINLYDSMNYKPSELIIELPPWYLNDNSGQTRWKSLESDYISFTGKLEGEKSMTNKISKQPNWSIDPKIIELLSFEYFQQSVRILIKSGKNDDDMFKEPEFKKGYILKNFYTQLKPLINPNMRSEIVDDTIGLINDFMLKPDLYDIVKRIYPDQEFPEELVSLRSEITSNVQGKSKEVTNIQNKNVRKLNRKLLELVFYETCPASTSVLTYPTQKKDNPGLTRIADGTISYPLAYRNQTLEEINYSVQSFLNTPIFGLKDFSEISQVKLGLLSSTLDYLKKHGIKVKLILVPYHPIVYKVITTKMEYQNVLEAEKIFYNLAVKNGIEIAGSYDPQSCNLAAEDFYDAMHPKELAFNKILSTTLRNTTH
jgi:hypothetical protein